MTPLISILTGTWNRLAHLQALVESVRHDIPVGVPHEIVIVDGGSTDGTPAWCEAQADVVFIQQGELRGAIDAFTEGGHHCAGKYTAILNDDVTVTPGTLMRAVVYLEENMQAGMVAFADNRPVPYYPPDTYHTLSMPAIENGAARHVLYGQCCLVRTWLAEHFNWWRGHDERFTSKTYGGDNLLSANIWQAGYNVDSVEGCRVRDKVADDDLRKINAAVNDRQYYDVYPVGPTIPPAPVLKQQHSRQLRILYLPVYEPGWEVQKRQKRGLRDALARRYIVEEVDYVAYRNHPAALLDALRHLLDVFQPDLMLTQLHGADIVTPAMLLQLRASYPRLVIVNWNGDYWPHGLTAPDMLQLLQHVELQLTVNASVLPVYAESGISAAYWQIGYEEPDEPLPDAPAHDVVFLGNAYSEERQALGRLIMSFADHHCYIGLYGSGWADEAGQSVSDGNTTYDFATSAAIYRNAKLSIGDSQFPDAYGFVSNRIFQALAAGGALLLHQRVNGLYELTGIEAGVHYAEWTTYDELRALIRHWLDPANEAERYRIAEAGTAFVRTFHSFDRRVQELFGADGLIKQARRQPAKTIALVFTGAMAAGGMVGKITNRHYEFERGVPLSVDALDAPLLVATGQWRPVV